jgi:predicted amidohydrolase
MAEKPDDMPGIILADLDMDAVTWARGRIPSLGNDQEISFQ